MWPIMAVSAATRVYQPREAQKTVLHQVVREYLPKFLEEADLGGYNIPAFVHWHSESTVAAPGGGHDHGKRCRIRLRPGRGQG